MTKKIESTVEKITKELLEHLEAKAKVEVAKNEEGLMIVRLESEEPAILIGYHGQTINAIQLLIGMMAYRRLGEWVRILVEVNDYRQRRKETLERMAFSVAQRAKFSGESQVLSPMPSVERRIIHLALAEDPEVETISEGEGDGRRIVVRPRHEDEARK